ncbi:hypothetical protein HYFRA_00002955 [Hymenoscyphus fraxineus]|uniref:S-adenosyl-L-methionine-dependent methyltransferase n=1 Tax=Hymenoscyphus fraxineus TaxID=746836 RepID=A0A9N9KN00_9HELO|nr:hypothetical protein HYFRA_00002955 [Hymenoscyphus fraxineus]
MRPSRLRIICNGPGLGTRIWCPRKGLIKHGLYTRSLSGTKATNIVRPSQKVTKARPPPQYRSAPKNQHERSEPPRPGNRETLLKFHRWISIALGAYIAYRFAFPAGQLAVAFATATPSSAEPSAQSDVSSRYDDIAERFDDEVECSETLMGLTSLRKKLTEKARGDVLEVSIGTGRNLEFYEFDFRKKDLWSAPPDNAFTLGYAFIRKNVMGAGESEEPKEEVPMVTSFTAVDKSGEMLEIAHQKFGKLFPGVVGVRWIIGDAQEPGKIPPPPKNSNEWSGNKEGKKYDTILQTMGLCSVENPVALLKRLGELVKEEEGRILLLEHGRSRWGWLNVIVDALAERHAKKYGCWWNRDLEKIVEGSGLDVVEFKTQWQDGHTVAWIELKKPKTKELEISEAVKPQSKKGWW